MQQRPAGRWDLGRGAICLLGRLRWAIGSAGTCRWSRVVVQAARVLRWRRCGPALGRRWRSGTVWRPCRMSCRPVIGPQVHVRPPRVLHAQLVLRPPAIPDPHARNVRIERPGARARVLRVGPPRPDMVGQGRRAGEVDAGRPGVQVRVALVARGRGVGGRGLVRDVGVERVGVRGEMRRSWPGRGGEGVGAGHAELPAQDAALGSSLQSQ